MYLLAGISTFLAIPALLLAGYFGLLFFQGRGERYGPLNDMFSALTIFLLVPTAIAVNTLADGRVEGWFQVVTWLAVAGMLLAGVGQLLLVAGTINLQTSFITGTVGIIPVLVWMTSLAVISIRYGDPAAPVGWAMALALGLIVPTALLPAFRVRMSVRLLFGGILTLALVVWLLALGVDLLDRA
jgi:hypothetical protein